MTDQSPRTIRWGILATGGIAKTFAIDLLLPPTERQSPTPWLSHTVVAAASSTSADRAREFLKETKSPKEAKAYGSYQELADDPNVEIVYVASPHSHHYQNARLCLEAGKHVLCEKAFTTNAAQARILVDLAREKGLFLMEAVWTRYFPLSEYVRSTIRSGGIGALVRVETENNLGFDFAGNSDNHRLVAPGLAGGALLDSGIYALTWAFITTYSTQIPEKRKAPRVQAVTMTKWRTGVDDSTTIYLEFDNPEIKGHEKNTDPVSVVCSTTLLKGPSDEVPPVRIYGTDGEIHVYAPTFRPTRVKLLDKNGELVKQTLFRQPGHRVGSGWFNGFGDDIQEEGEIQGMAWEADDAGKALVEGRQEGSQLGWEETIQIMEVMDEARKIGGLVYPRSIESTEYPLTL